MNRFTGTVNIRPGVSILAVLPHLNYKPWYAMAEFVDNSVQSYLENRAAIDLVEGKSSHIDVSVEYKPSDDQLTIRDNAAGIHASEYACAFRPAAAPNDRSGLSEFGMGMKSAACWFAREWTVRTKALDEDLERTIHFDIDRIVRDDLEELQVLTKPELSSRHYTEIVLTNLHNPPRGRTLGKMKEHLASIYRVFIREGVLVLRFDGDILTYETPDVLCAPYFKNPEGSSVLWRRDIDIDLGLGLRVTGFAALRDVASTSSAGFALFRRNRLIEGSGEESYRPSYIFGSPNSYTYQRLFGEMHLEGFEVSHTKDGFRWQEHEETFLELLKEELDASPVPLLKQAEGYRAKQRIKDLKRSAELATAHTAETMQRELPAVLPKQLAAPPDETLPPPAFSPLVTASKRTITVDLQNVRWEIDIELSADPVIGDWIEFCEQPTIMLRDATASLRKIGMRLSLTHPFMERFAGNDQERIEPLLRVAAGLMLAEVIARNGGVKQAGTIRRNLNDLLRDALSKP